MSPAPLGCAGGTVYTDVVGAEDELGDVDVARAGRHGRDAVVAGRQAATREHTGNHVTRRVVAAAHAATVQSSSRADHSVAAHHLQTAHSPLELVGGVAWRLWAYYNCDTSTIGVRFERDTTSYEELCAFEQ